jgi:hypothetical protein
MMEGHSLGGSEGAVLPQRLEQHYEDTDSG